MLRVDVMQAEPGMTLALPVHNPGALSRVLLKAGYALTEASIERAKELGVRSLWVAYPSLGAVEQYLTLESLRVQQELASTIAETFEQTQGEAVAKLDYEKYSTSVKSMVDHVVTNPKTAVFIGELAESDNDSMRHASTVTYLSVLMGMKLEAYMVRQRKHVNPARAKEIVNLGVGAMLHDFGMGRLDEDVRERFEETGDESDPAYREHASLGFRAVRGQIEPSAATVLLHHHQRFDGSGFTGKDFAVQAGPSIHVFARIVGAADQFDRLRRPPNLPAQPTVAVLGAMLSESMRPKFDPVVLRALLEVVPPYAPGCPLRLSDGRSAVCVDHQPAEPCRPVVQTLDEGGEDGEGETLDLTADEHRGLSVVECDGQPTGEFNFAGEALPAAA
ncbi:MAG: HD domain-containing phosphohydrolase [Planctomycetota bacterium]